MDTYLIACLFKSHICSHTFATEPVLNTADYRRDIFILCPICNKTHYFIVDKIYTLTTPKRIASFERLCDDLKLSHRGVDITIQKPGRSS